MSDRRFYVYVIFDMQGVPRYVGKGSGSRMFEKDRAYNPRLARLFKFGNPPVVRIRADMTESEAFELERLMVVSIGRIPDGPLFNVVDGGRNPVLPEESIRKMARSRQSRELWDAARSAARGDYRGHGELELARAVAPLRVGERAAFVERLVRSADQHSSDLGISLRVAAIRLGLVA